VMELWFVSDEAEMLKRERRRRAIVVLPEEEGPERPTMRFLMRSGGLLVVIALVGYIDDYKFD
jgi:hypothetical protein